MILVTRAGSRTAHRSLCPGPPCTWTCAAARPQAGLLSLRRTHAASAFGLGRWRLGPDPSPVRRRPRAGGWEIRNVIVNRLFTHKRTFTCRSRMKGPPWNNVRPHVRSYGIYHRIQLRAIPLSEYCSRSTAVYGTRSSFIHSSTFCRLHRFICEMYALGDVGKRLRWACSL